MDEQRPEKVEPKIETTRIPMWLCKLCSGWTRVDESDFCKWCKTGLKGVVYRDLEEVR